jgi:hypothetical protein
MAIGYSTTVRNARLQAVADAINGGSGAGKLRIYSGSRPATGGTATTLLGEITLNDPAQSGIAAGVLTLDVSPTIQDASADASGTATWARILDSADTFVCDLDVGATGSGADIELSSTSIVAGGTITVTSGTITAGNA